MNNMIGVVLFSLFIMGLCVKSFYSQLGKKIKDNVQLTLFEILVMGTFLLMFFTVCILNRCMYIYSDTTKYKEILQLTRACRWLSGINLVMIILYSILYFIYSKNKRILFSLQNLVYLPPYFIILLFMMSFVFGLCFFIDPPSPSILVADQNIQPLISLPPSIFYTPPPRSLLIPTNTLHPYHQPVFTASPTDF